MFWSKVLWCLQLCSFSSGLVWLCRRHTNSVTVLPSFVKNATGILIGTVLTLKITLRSVDILTILILPIYRHDPDVCPLCAWVCGPVCVSCLWLMLWCFQSKGYFLPWWHLSLRNFFKLSWDCFFDFLFSAISLLVHNQSMDFFHVYFLSCNLTGFIHWL